MSAQTRQTVGGWGLLDQGQCDVVALNTASAISQEVKRGSGSGGSLIARGAGYSYGDAGINDSQGVLDVTGYRGIEDWNPHDHTALVRPGVTISQLAAFALAQKHWPPVVPGISAATIGGCVSTNVHGKNSPEAGVYGEHVQELEVVAGDGEQVRCSRETQPDLFWAAIGGYGLIGVITGARVRFRPLQSGLLRVEELAIPNLESMLQLFELRAGSYDAAVGWIDGFAQGESLGRGLLQLAQELPLLDSEPVPAATASPPSFESFPSALLRRISKVQPWSLWRPFVRPKTFQLLNSAVYERGLLRSGHVWSVSLPRFHFVHDHLPGWNSAFKPVGVLQFQMFVPRDQTLGVFTTALKRVQALEAFPFLAVLKRHRRDRFLLSYGVDGYSLSLDFHVTATNQRPLTAALRELAADVVLPSGGRFYPAKDAILSRDHMLESCGAERVAEFLARKRRYDPNQVFQSNLYRRLLI